MPCAWDLQKQQIIQLAMQTHYIYQQLHCYTLLIMYRKERIDGDADRQRGLNSVRLALATPLSYTFLAERSPQVPHKKDNCNLALLSLHSLHS